MQKTIRSVKPQFRDWSSSYGPMKSIDGYFEDEDEFTINCKPGNEEKVKADLQALVGQPLEGYSIEPSMDKNTGRQREYQGRLKWTLKAQQQQGGFRGNGSSGGGKQWTESYAQSRECKETEQRSIQRAVALERAIQYAATFSGQRAEEASVEYVLKTADKLFAWLSDGKPQPTPVTAVNGHNPEGYGVGTTAPEVVRPSQEYIVWESNAKTLQAKHDDLWPTWQDLLQDLKGMLQAIGLGTPRLLKECRDEAKFRTLIGTMKTKIADAVPF
jgi:hypothetical protein